MVNIHVSYAFTVVKINYNFSVLFYCFRVNRFFAERSAALHSFCVGAELFTHFKAGGALADICGQHFKVAQSRGYPRGK